MISKQLIYEKMITELQQNNTLEEKLSLIISYLDSILDFSSLGIFYKIPHMELYRYKTGRNLSHSFAKNTFFSPADPLIEELTDLKLLEMKYPGRYIFEKDYSHLLIAPIHIQNKLLGFVFIDKEEGFFDQEEISKFRSTISIISLVSEICLQQKELEQHKEMYEFFKIYNRKAFIQQLEIIFSMMKRYNRYLSLIVLDIGNYNKILRMHGEVNVKKLVENICLNLRSNLRESDMVGLLAENKISVLLPETSEKNSLITINRLVSKIEDIALIQSCKIGWGVSSKLEETNSYEMILKNAEQAARESLKKKSQVISNC